MGWLLSDEKDVSYGMGAKILVFNIGFYFVTFGMFEAAQSDPSISLGIGIYIAIFWAIALIVLAVLVTKKIIWPRSAGELIGVVFATPAPCIIALTIYLSVRDTPVMVYYPYKDHYQYKVESFDDRNGGSHVEYHRSADTTGEGSFWNGAWVKDSVWVYLSPGRDTVKKMRYRNGVFVSEMRPGDGR